MFFKNMSKRNFFRLLAGGVATPFAIHWANAQPAAHLNVGRTSTGIRVVATVIPPSSLWELQRSTDGINWTTLSDEETVVGSGRIRWDISTTSEQIGIFRLRLSTVLKIANKTHRITANQTLFAAMISLRTSAPSFSFVSEYRTEQQGQFVTEINGTKGKWVYEVNGQRIDDIGSSQYTLKPNDEVRWFLV